MRISNSEWRVMRILWSKPGLTSNQIFTIISQNEEIEWEKTTVKTLLSRLVGKGVLRTEIQGREYTYFPELSEKQGISDSVIGFSERICATRLSETIYDLIEQSTLSMDSIDSLEKLLKEKKKLAPLSIQCNCL